MLWMILVNVFVVKTVEHGVTSDVLKIEVVFFICYVGGT